MIRHAIALVICFAAGVPPAGANPGDPLPLSVEDAVRSALDRGEAAEIARQDVAWADAQKAIALSLAMPHLNLDAAYNRNLKRPVIFFPDEDGITRSIELGEDNDYRATLALNQTLYSFGRVGSGYRGAKEGHAAARLEGRAAASDIALAVRSAYYAALLAREQAGLAARSLEVAERRRDDIAARVENGVRPRFDLLRAELEVAERRPALTRARNGAVVAEEELKRVAGLPFDRTLTLTDSLAYRPFESDREAVVREALSGRPDLAAARRSAQSSRSFLRTQASNDLPILSLVGNYTWQGQTSDGLIPDENQTADIAAVGLSLTWPIFDGFDNRGRTRQMRANATRAELAVRSLERAVEVETRSAWNDVVSIAEELLGAEEAIRVAEEAYAIADVRYANGLSTQLELLDSDLALDAARITRSETLFRYNVAVATLEHALGRGPELIPEGAEP